MAENQSDYTRVETSRAGWCWPSGAAIPGRWTGKGSSRYWTMPDEPPLDPPADPPECPECDGPLLSPLDGCPWCGWEPIEPDYTLLEDPDA